MSSAPSRTGRPRFTGVTSYRDELGRYEFRHPSDWFRLTLDHGLDGVIVGPDENDDATHFAVAVHDLQVDVVADDLETLREGFDEGLAGLPDVEVLDSTERLYNEIVRLERTITFTDQGETRKRRVWSLYAGHWQYTVEYQGSSVEEFHYWLPMGNYCFSTFNLPLALWFATDPTVNSTS